MRFKFLYDDWYIKEIPLENFEYVFLSSDGVSDDIRPDVQTLFVRDLVTEYSIENSRIRTKKIKRMLLNWPVPMHSDDKTIACLVNRGDKQIG
jgi:hypothetical protein